MEGYINTAILVTADAHSSQLLFTLSVMFKDSYVFPIAKAL